MSFQGMEVGVPVRGYNISTWWLLASRQEKGDLILFSWHLQLVLQLIFSQMLSRVVTSSF